MSAGRILTYGSLFSGCGGLDLGLEQAGMECLWQCEVDKYANRILEKRWPKVKRYGDITKVNWEEAERPDLICGGFPCQDISIAGRGLGLAGERSGLWTEFRRCLGHFRPEYAFVENVPALLIRGVGTVLRDLAALGYDAEWDCIPAGFVGAHQLRSRLFILAYPQHGRLSQRWRIENAESHAVGRSRVQGHERQGVQLETEPIPALAAGVRQQRERAERKQEPETFRGKRIFNWCRSNGFVWPVEPNVGRVAHGVPNRAHRIRVLGNAVVPQVAELIGRAIIHADAVAHPL